MEEDTELVKMVTKRTLDKWKSRSFLALGIVTLLFLFMFYIASGGDVQQSSLGGDMPSEESDVPLSLAVAGVVFTLLNAALHSHTGQVITMIINVLFYSMMAIIMLIVVLMIWKNRKKR